MTEGLPPLPSLPPPPGRPGLPGLPPLPSMGPVTRQVPPGGARRHWQTARVLGLREETATARTFVLQLDADTPRHTPGQHYDVRLTAPDGSQAQRSYSIASAPFVAADLRPASRSRSGPLVAAAFLAASLRLPGPLPPSVIGRLPRGR